MNQMFDAHWFSLESQGNIYSMTSLLSCTENDKILVASLRRKIYSCEYNILNQRRLKPVVKELLFTYLPSGAKIVSIDTYNNSKTDVDEFVIGVTIIKPSSDNTVERYLNVYTEAAAEGEVSPSLEVIGQNCLMLELYYHPFHLYHTTLPTSSDCEIVWLISGCDNKIHLIREDKLNHSFKESPLDKFFPELDNLHAIALWINILYYQSNTKRISAVGCDNGLLDIAIVDVENIRIEKHWKLQYDDPICSVRVFFSENIVKPPCFLNIEDVENDEQTINILVLTATTAIVFRDILKNDLESDEIISKDNKECYLCSCIADINMDGHNEILLGTHGGDILVYSEVDGTFWDLIDKRNFDSPIYSLCSLDMTGDGVYEMAVMTLKGVHIFQHDPENIIERWSKRFATVSKDLLNRIHKT